VFESYVCGLYSHRCCAPRCSYRVPSRYGRHRVDLSSLSATKVSAEEARARLSNVPSYVKEWPICMGFCYHGMCALKWDHPACCSVHRSHYAAVDSQDEGVDVAANPFTQDAALNREHWEGQDWFCWD